MMKKAVKKVVTAAGLLAVTASQSVLAALPTPVAPSTGPAAGDWIGLISGYIKDGGLVLGLAIAVLGFLWIARRDLAGGWGWLEKAIGVLVVALMIMGVILSQVGVLQVIQVLHVFAASLLVAALVLWVLAIKPLRD